MKKQIFGRVGSILLSVCMLMAAVPLSALAAEGGNIYYVATNGSDTNDGSLSEPFKTLNHAASVLKAGDTCYIRGGVYRETLNATLNGTEESPITICAYQGETVTISGADLVTGWTQYEGNIYRAPMSWDIYSGIGNMVFADGELMTEARWPNAKTDELMEKSRYAVADGGTLGSGTATLTDDALPNVDLTDSVLWCAGGYAYMSSLWHVTARSGNTITVTGTQSSYNPKQGSRYYLFRSLALLDAENEWYLDQTNKQLYFYAPNGVDPNTITVEAKKREYAIRLENSSHVTFEGINVRGALIAFDSGTSYCSYNNAVAESLDYKMNDRTTGAARGIVVAGTHNTVSGCEIKNMFGEGITVEGDHNRLMNNYIHDINFEHTYSDGIYMTGAYNTAAYNTVKRTGRGTIGGRFDSCVIAYNDLSEPNAFSKDSGVIYLNAHDYKSSEIHHNVIHDSLDSEGLQFGFYLDSFSTGLVCYNNLIYNCDFTNPEENKERASVLIGGKSFDVLFINNTVANVVPFHNYSAAGRVMLNNLFWNESGLNEATTTSGSGTYIRFNQSGADFWQNMAAGDYTLAAGSTAIDSALLVPGINDDYIGNAPDCGAFEYGRAAWRAGHDFTQDMTAVEIPLNDDIPFRNLVKNGGFEDETLAPWQVTAGNPQQIKQDSWDYWNSLTKEGKQSLMLHEGDSMSYTMSGLKPNTSYRISSFGRISGEYVPCNSYAETSMSPAPTNSGEAYTLRNLSDGWLRYDAIDFKNGEIDQMMLTLRCNPLTGGQKYNADAKVYIDGVADGNLIAELHIDGSYNENYWKWATLSLKQAVSGVHSVYISFSNVPNAMYFGGFHLLSSTSKDVVTVSAACTGGIGGRMKLSAATDFDVRQDFIATTGETGALTLTVAKSGGVLCGYLDAFSVREEMFVPQEPSGFEVLEVSAADLSGNRVYRLHEGESYVFSALVKNNNKTGLHVSGVLYNTSGEQSGTQEVFCAAGGTQTVSVTADAWRAADGPALRVYDRTGKVGRFPLTENLLEAMSSQTDGMVQKEVVIRNSEGQVATALTGGALNIVEVHFKSFYEQAVDMNGILAVYDADGRLVDMMSFNTNVPSQGNACAGLGMVVPETSGTKVKLFVWRAGAGMNPMLSMNELTVK